MRGVRVEFLIPDCENSQGQRLGPTWIGILRAEGFRGLAWPSCLHPHRADETAGRGVYAYPLQHYRTIRPAVRHARKLAHIRGLKTRTICGEITPLDHEQGLLKGEER